jgi:putative membrane protein
MTCSATWSGRLAEVGPELEPDYRFSLANERTFLAYERTAIGLVAAALAVFHLLDPDWPQRVLGGLLIVAGGVAAVGGYLRFRSVDRAIRAGRPLAANPTAHLLALAVMICLVAAAISVLAG